MFTLSHVMKANAISCIGFGFLFLLIPETVSHFLSTNEQAPEILIALLGSGLILNGSHLIWASFKPIPPKFLVLYFSFGDYLWVMASAYLVISGLWITTTEGISATILVAAFVGMFGFLQMVKRKAMGSC